MVEVFVIFGFLGCLFVAFLQWLSSLPVFPALVAGAILSPFLGCIDYARFVRSWRLGGVLSKRDPIPPERFYWISQRCRLRRIIARCILIGTVAWFNALMLPASSEVSAISITGWANASLGILALARALSAGALYYNASQRFDAQSPGFVGLFRHAMYKLSDNYEYLHPTKRDHEKEEVY